MHTKTKMILIINTCSEPLHELEFVKPLFEIAKPLNKTIVKHYSKLTSSDKSKSTKIILSGTSLKDEDYLNNLEKFEWIKEKNCPILGICAGAQILGLLFDGKLKKNLEIGMQKINFKKEFLGLIGEKEFYALHQNYIEFSPEFEIFAMSKIPQAAKHKTKEIYAILPHPEVRNKEIIKKFCSNN